MGREVLYRLVPERFRELRADLEALVGFSFADTPSQAASILPEEVEA